jgi:anti-anti-sigma factor
MDVDPGARFSQESEPTQLPPSFIESERDGAWVISARGEWDMDTVPPLAEALGSAAEKYSRVVLDVTDVTFSDSTFLNLLLRINRETSLRVVGVPPQMGQVFEITGADSVLDLRDTVEGALTP